MRGFHVDELRQCTDLLNKYTEEMKAVPLEEWTTGQIDLCLYYSMSKVHLAIALYEYDFEALPASVEDVVVAGYIDEIPANPFEDWAPMQVLGPDDPFLPGALVYQVCPADFYSFVANDERVPLSYELSVYAPFAEYASPVNPAPIKYNADWAIVPDNTLAMIGMYNESATRTLEKRAERAAAKAEREAEQAAATEGVAK